MVQGVEDGERDLRVFLNYPFDADYERMALALNGTVVFCGRAPRTTLYMPGTATQRSSKIIQLIRECRFSIHDLSPRLDSKGRPRLNMALELGVAIGMAEAFDHEWFGLIDETHSYKEFASDLAGFDLFAHKNDQARLVRRIRTWLW